MSSATVAVSIPQVKRKFAVRRQIKIVALVCECGATTHGPGVRKWKVCPSCGAFVIRSSEQRRREQWYAPRGLDEEIYARAEGNLKGGAL
jgi:predicted RNA-binding Zn-ribbon protein involved in translation (DUF1610 family)